MTNFWKPGGVKFFFVAGDLMGVSNIKRKTVAKQHCTVKISSIQMRPCKNLLI